MAYMRRGALVERFTITASSAGTLTLLNNSTTFQVITGTQSHTIQLPDATTCDGGSTGKGGQKFYIVNNSTQRIVINNAGGTRVLFLPSKAEALIVLTDDTSANGVWRYSVPTIIDQPMRASAGEPADSKVYFKANTVTDFDGTELVTPPVKGLIPTVPASTHDLQSGATTGATFNNAALPTTTVGQFRRIGYSLLPTGIIQVLYTVAAATEGALADPGTVFAKDALPIAWVDVEATGSNAFKTIGSSSAIVENYAGGTSRIHKFGSGGGAGGSGGAGMPVNWVQSAVSPIQEIEFDNSVYKFTLDGGQKLFAFLKVPESYMDSQIKIKTQAYSPDSTTATAKLRSVSTLIRKGLDAMTSVVNQHTHTPVDLNLGPATVNIPLGIEFELSDADGKINGVKINPGDLIKVSLESNGGTSTQELRLNAWSSEVMFS